MQVGNQGKRTRSTGSENGDSQAKLKSVQGDIKMEKGEVRVCSRWH